MNRSYSHLLLAATFVLTAHLSASKALGADAPGDDTVKITILQVNDVYQEEPVDNGSRGGLARVGTLKNQIIAAQPHTLFMLAGDTLSPSAASTIFKGKQMIACWDALGIDVATFGNHEFDFGPEVLKKRMAESTFPWTCANVIDRKTGKPFAGIPTYVIKDVDGVKVGIFGLLTQDTIPTSHTGPEIDITEPTAAARQAVKELRAAKADIIVGLTHELMSVDKEVAWSAPIDVIVGGHEHIVLQSEANGTPIVKSGCDAQNLGRIDLNYSRSRHKIMSVDWTLLPVTDKIPDDAKVKAVVDGFEQQLKGKLDETVAETTVPLDALQLDNGTKETNLGDFIADTYRAQTRADVAVLNSGSIRSNKVYVPGPLSRRDLVAILPFENPIVKLRISGATLRLVLENSLSKIGEKPSGRFLQVSGLHFAYDASRPAGQRVTSAAVGNAALDANAFYTLSTNNFVAEGGDNYTMLRGQQLLITPEEGETEASVLMQAVSKTKTVAPALDGRIRRVDTPTATPAASAASP